MNRTLTSSRTTWSGRCSTPRCGSTPSCSPPAPSSRAARSAWGYQLWYGIGLSGKRWPTLLGAVSHELRVLDRHQPRRHADLGDPAAGQRRMAPPGHALRRSDHGVRADDRRDVPDHPPGPPVAGVLAVPVSERARDLAELPLAAGVGLLRDQHLSHRQPAVPVPADDSGLRADPRSRPPAGGARVYGTLSFGWRGTTKQWNRLESAMQIMADRHPAGRRLGAHHRVVRLLDGQRADVALDDLRALLRRRRDLQRHRRA